jgi:hypothetical protein
VRFAFGEPVTRLRAGTITDPYSAADAQDWDAPTSLIYERCAVWPSGSAEPLSADRQSISSDVEVAFPPGADVTARDRLVIRGDTYLVAGAPYDWRSPFTDWRPGLVARANRVEG